MTLGEFGLLLVILGSIPYIVQIFRGSVRPERMTWFIWMLVLALALWSYRSSGAEDSIWFLVGDFVVVACIFLLSLWRGQGGWTRLDVACLAIAGISLLLWQISHIPLFALWGVLIADGVAAVPTIVKSLKDPASEHAVIYALGSAGALCGFIAVGKWDFNLLFYPGYIFLVNLILAVVIWVGQYQRGQFKQGHS